MARPTDRYSIVSITLHWLMLVLVALAYLTMELDDLHIRGLAIESWHFTFGLSVLALIWLRVLAILIWKPPAAPTEHKLARQGALLMHVALYALMIGMPVAGWIAAGEEGEIIRFFGIVIPPLLSGSETFGELGEDADGAAEVTVVEEPPPLLETQRGFVSHGDRLCDRCERPPRNWHLGGRCVCPLAGAHPVSAGSVKCRSSYLLRRRKSRTSS